MKEEETNAEKKLCLIKSNQDIKDLLLDHITQAGLTFTDVVAEAREKHNRKFNLPMLSRYFKKGQVSCQISQSDIIWLCDRYGISVRILVTKTRNSNKSNLQRIKRKYG